MKALRSMVACCVLMMLAGSARAADGLPSLEDMKKMETDGKWSELAAACAQVVNLRGEAAKAYPPVEVWLLRGEAQLQLNQFSPASLSFGKVPQQEGVEQKVADQAEAMSQLLKRTDARGYTPRPTRQVPKPQTYPIIDKAARSAAIKALYESELSEVKSDLATTKTKFSFSAVEKTIRQIVELQPLERAATEKADTCKALVDEATAMVGDMMVASAEKMNTEVERIEKNANETVRVPDPKDKTNKRFLIRKKGLSSSDRQALQKMITDCRKVASDYQEVERLLKDKPTNSFADAPKKVTQLHDNAERVLKGDYSDVHREKD
jgi:hypothetical protein